MITIEYKIICEVVILHDYYLISSNYTSFFALNPSQQQVLLNRKLRSEQYDVNRDLNLIISMQDQALLRSYRFIVLPNPLGFQLAIEVKSEKDPSGAILYKPAVPLPEDFSVRIGLDQINPIFDNITNLELSSLRKSVYAFSNEENRIAGTLSRPVTPYDPGRSYKMGELAMIGGNVQQVTEDNTGDLSKWEPVSGEGFVNAADRTLDTEQDEFKDWMLGVSSPPRRLLGVIDLYAYAENPSLSLIDSDGYLVTRRNPGIQRPVNQRFELRFLSRGTYWRYRKKEGFTNDEIERIKTKSAGFLVFDNSVFTTLKPRYYTQSLIRFENSLALFPNANPTALREEGARLFSDIYFNKVIPIPS